MESGSAAVVIGVDTGGTFTDVFSSSGAVHKLSSVASDPSSAILHGLQAVGLTSRDSVGHGTTVATNAVLERKGATTALITTAGFEDVLEIRRQNRPSLYDLNARWPEPLIPREMRFGVHERLDYGGRVLDDLENNDLDRVVDRIVQAKVQSVAICLLFSYANAEHEERIERALRDRCGDNLTVSVSHDIAPQYGEFERTSTTVVNAYVMPVMRRYLLSLNERLQSTGVRHLHVMHSNGGLVDANQAALRPVGTILSGPAAGVVGAKAVSSRAGHKHIISFDMGGTSTDVAVVPGEVLQSGQGEISSYPLLIPMLTIETVGAGGGSIARLDSGGGLHVGPHSAGADPGPAAYGVGTEPTVTDANLVLGRLSPEGLLGGDMPLDMDRARQSLQSVAEPLALTIEQAAWAIVRLTNSNMQRSVHRVTLHRGHDPRRFTLFPFGGAGPLHAAELADDLGIETLLVPPHPGVMAALGLTIPDLQRNFQRTFLLPLDNSAPSKLESAFATLESHAVSELRKEELFGEPVLKRSVDMRYVGQSFDLPVSYALDVASLRKGFLQIYERIYGRAHAEKPIDIVNIRLQVTLPRLTEPEIIPRWPEADRTMRNRQVWFGSSEGARDVKALSACILWRPSLRLGTTVEGPAVLEQYDSATLVPPGWRAKVDEYFNVEVVRV